MHAAGRSLTSPSTRCSRRTWPPDQRSHKLEDGALRLLGVSSEGSRGSDALFDMGEIGAGPSAAQVRAERAWPPATDKLRRALDERRNRAPLTDMEMPLSRLLAQMETTGIAPRTRASSTTCPPNSGCVVDRPSGSLDRCRTRVNLSSPSAQEILSTIALPRPENKTDTTNADALADLWAKDRRLSGGDDYRLCSSTG